MFLYQCRRYSLQIDINNKSERAFEPYQYLREILTKLPCTETVEELEDLFPWNINMAIQLYTTYLEDVIGIQTIGNID
ncbi:MAG: transposase domain-containing protein [Endozoicomonadaceae bacterium]|nr:transposase domain-containing protein [Endozoicomonadaceae bacterium]